MNRITSPIALGTGSQPPLCVSAAGCCCKGQFVFSPKHHMCSHFIFCIWSMNHTPMQWLKSAVIRKQTQQNNNNKKPTTTTVYPRARASKLFQNIGYSGHTVGKEKMRKGMNMQWWEWRPLPSAAIYSLRALSIQQAWTCSCPQSYELFVQPLCKCVYFILHLGTNQGFLSQSFLVNIWSPTDKAHFQLL